VNVVVPYSYVMLSLIGMTWEEAEESAASREDWHRSVAQCVYDTG